MRSGIYLIIDPSMDETRLLAKLEEVASTEIAAVQIWDNFHPHQQVAELAHEVCRRCRPHGIPVLINNRWQLLLQVPLDGVHFDAVPDDLDAIRKNIHRNFITGITCNNDLSVVEWAERNNADYISFCSLFPSQTSTSCDLVSHDTISRARSLTRMPIFLAGGIRPSNIHKLKGLPFNGVAVVSGIMNEEQPAQTVNRYLEQLKPIWK